KNARASKIMPSMSQKRKAPEPAVVSLDPYAALPAIMPSPTEDYKGFLKYQKQKWKIQKQQRVRRKQLFGDKSNINSNDIGAVFRNQAELLYTTTWQVLQLTETGTPGEVRAFVLIDRKVHALRIKVPRQVFL